ncbi:hypothetical protein MA16_Dca007630 [Dendrobium catenatum]|uniref:Uncharacterized protein n=1 Tax=Dendrobium catenatum TaxID=906689 RepID=A0A2I0X0U6_9ASPA|nr:hypothetical protein MA16_Dca007630 [Dendrobium catenatum]
MRACSLLLVFKTCLDIPAQGIWDTGNIGQSRDHLEASHYFRRKKAYSDQRRSSQSFRSPKSPEGVEDWDLPMDY